MRKSVLKPFDALRLFDTLPHDEWEMFSNIYYFSYRICNYHHSRIDSTWIRFNDNDTIFSKKITILFSEI